MFSFRKVGADSSAKPVVGLSSFGSLILSSLMVLGSISAPPVAWFGMATLLSVPNTVYADSTEPPCDPADAGDNDNDGDENCTASTLGKNIGNPKKASCNCTNPEGTSGDPIDNATGNIYTQEEDIRGGGAFPLRLTRSYNSGVISMLYMSTMSTSMSAMANNKRILGDDKMPRSEIESSVYPVAEATSTSGIASYIYPFGYGWSFSLGARLLLDSQQSLTSLEALRGDGQVLTFTLSNGVWGSDADVNAYLTAQTNASGAITGWTLTDADLNVEQYDATGHLLTLTNRAGMTQTFAYSTANTPTSVAPGPGLLIGAADPSGRTMMFTYNAQSQINGVTDASGGHYVYAYDTNGYLKSVTYPDSSVRGYTYVYSGLASFYLLSSVVDETNTTYENFEYDPSSQEGTSTSLAGGVNQVTLITESGYDGNVGLTSNVFGAVSTFDNNYLVNGFRNSHVTTRCLNCANSGVNDADYTYNPNGYVATVTNVMGDGSTPRNLAYTWDTTSNLLQTFVDGVGSPQQRTTNTTWNNALRTPLTRTVANASGTTVASTAWVYNGRGQAVVRCEIDPTVSYTCGNSGTAPTGVRRWTYTYCDAVDATQCPIVGLMLSVIAPRTDLTQTTSFAYYTTSSSVGCGTPGAACYQAGDLKSVTDPLGHVTKYVSYDGLGRLTRMTDPNNVNTDMTYTQRGWLQSQSIAGATTRFTYMPYGEVKTVTDADGYLTTFGYDPAHRLTDIFDGQNNDLHYTLNLMGEKTGVEVLSASGAVSLKSTASYDILGRLTTVLDGVNNYVFIAYFSDSYDGNGSLVHSSDAEGYDQKNAYDALGRLTTTIKNYNGTDTATQNTTSTYSYDALDRITSVTDPSSLTTTYGYDGLNDLSSLQSPDTGHANATFDAAGNELTHTDANGTISTMYWDADNRLWGLTLSDGNSGFVRYYDDGYGYTGCVNSNPIGRVTRQYEYTFATVYCYDPQGRVTKKSEDMGGNYSDTYFSYTPGGRLKTVLTPDGTLTTYSYDSYNGQLIGVTSTLPGTSTAINIVGSIIWNPFGPIASYMLGNGQLVSRTYDKNYRLTDLTSPAFNLHFARDPMGNLKAEGNTVGANSPVEIYKYDPLYRLTNITDAGVNVETLTYNGSGDRLTKSGNGLGVGAYTYSTGTHQLLSVGNAARQSDADGNTTANVSGGLAWGYGYDGRNRLLVVQANNSTVGTYTYNAWGQRIMKVATSPSVVTQHYAYDMQNQIIGENASSGNRDTIWMGNIPVATVDTVGSTNTVNYIVADHLGTPRAVTNASGATIWSLPYVGNPFGEASPTSSGGYTLNLRSPGQYFDAESGTTYNSNRTYDPTTGRYLTSDPIGLRAGISTYAYVGNDPLSRIDPLGLWQLTIGVTASPFGVGPGGILTFGYNHGQLNVGGWLGGSAGDAFAFSPIDAACHEPGSFASTRGDGKIGAGEAGIDYSAQSGPHVNSVDFSAGVPGVKALEVGISVDNGVITPTPQADIVGGAQIFLGGGAQWYSGGDSDGAQK